MARPNEGEILRRGVRAGLLAALPSGAPSTLHALFTRQDPLAAAEAAGSILLPRETRRARLLLAAVPAHLGISATWGTVLAATLPHKRPFIEGAVAGLLIGGFDLLIVGRRWPRIRQLQLGPQLLDHIAFGIATAVFLGRHATHATMSDFR